MLVRAGSTPTAAGRDVVGSGIGSEGALPGDRRLRAHTTAEVTIQGWGGRERRRQKQKSAADRLGPRMVLRQRSMSSSTETQVAGGVRTLRHGLQTCRVSQMREVARTLAGKHFTESQKDCVGHTRTPSPASLVTKAADPASQATGRQEKVVKELEWGTRPRVTTLALPRCGSLGRAPHLHAILKHWADDRVNDAQFRSNTKTRRHQYRSPRVESS
jgi:hypothetical protein